MIRSDNPPLDGTHDTPVSYYSPWECCRDIEELSFSWSRTVQSERKQLKYIVCD